MPLKKYDIFMIDPPWEKRKGGLRKARPKQQREFDYTTMSVPAIFKLLDELIFPAADTVHCVFMWTIDQYLVECEQEMAKRGYRRHCRFVWDKTNGIAPAFTVRFSHEYLIWYYKPKLLPVAADQRGKYKTVFAEKIREHSRKPECAYAMIDALFPGATKYDVFSREKRNTWDQFGDQTDFFNE